MFARLLITRFLALLLALLIGAAVPAVSQPAPAGPVTGVAVVGARVLTMTGAGALDDQTVLVEGDRIVRVGARAEVRVPPGYRVIDGRGRTLLPGLVDMHVHLSPTPAQQGDAAQRALAVMLASGVTTARGMAGSPVHLGVREGIEAGRITGPRFYAGAPAINYANAATPEAARALVGSAKTAGFDLIKSHHLEDLVVWQAVQDEAARLGMPVAGHVTNEVGLDRALAAHEQVEHLDGAIIELLAPDAPERQIAFAQMPPPAVIRAAARASDVQIEALARRVAASGVYQVPTLALFELNSHVEVPTATLSNSPDMRYVPQPALVTWTAQREQLAMLGLTTEDGALLRALRQRIVSAYHRAGVPMMAGSDTAQAFHIWGPGLIREVQALGAAGLPAMDALKAATVNPRNYFRSLPNGGSSLGWRADFGTVEAGARADLILLAADPSLDLKALETLQTVIKAGKVYDRAALDALLDQASRDAKAVPTPAPASVQTPPPPTRPQTYVMRHLPAGRGDDPALSLRGERMAARLAQTLGGAGLKAIFVTDTRRARETATPLAARLGLTPEVYAADDPAALAVRAAAVQGNVLVVGDGDTTPDLVARFGGGTVAAVGEQDFGRLWRIDSPGDLREFEVEGVAPAVLGPCEVAGISPRARCGTVAVPEDRTKPGGRVLNIRFGVIPASGSVKDGPLVLLPGGPGLGGVASGAGIDQLFGEMLNDRDLLLIDQRGTGASNPLFCPPAPEPVPGAPAPTADSEVRRCKAALEQKADLRLYDTRQAVLDMEVVRQALGYRRMDTYGMSYGTRMAIDYLRLYPDRIGETVIRSPAPAQMMLPLWTPRDAQVAYDNFVAVCDAQPDCKARYPDLAGNLRTIVERLKQGPVTVSVIDPATGERTEAPFDRDSFNGLLFFLLYVPEFYVTAPPLIEAAANGDFSPMVQTSGGNMSGTIEQIAWGMRWSVICNEDLPRIDRRRIAAAVEGTFMGSAGIYGELEACAIWPHRAMPADYFEPLHTDKPVFIISGEMDPIAGKPWGELLVRTLPNSLHVDVPGASHLPPLPGCTFDLMAKFISGVAPRDLDVSCVAKTPRPRLRVIPRPPAATGAG